MNREKLNYLSKFFKDDVNNCYSIIVSYNKNEVYNNKQIKNFIYNFSNSNAKLKKEIFEENGILFYKKRNEKIDINKCFKIYNDKISNLDKYYNIIINNNYFKNYPFYFIFIIDKDLSKMTVLSKFHHTYNDGVSVLKSFLKFKDINNCKERRRLTFFEIFKYNAFGIFYILFLTFYFLIILIISYLKNKFFGYFFNNELDMSCSSDDDDHHYYDDENFEEGGEDEIGEDKIEEDKIGEYDSGHGNEDNIGEEYKIEEDNIGEEDKIEEYYSSDGNEDDLSMNNNINEK